MRWSTLVVTAAVAAAALAAAALADPLPAVSIALGSGVGGAIVIQLLDGRRVRRLITGIDERIERADRAPVRRSGIGTWAQLDAQVRALLTAYDHRGVQLARIRPWRRELVESLAQPALLFSTESRLLAANAGARELLGIPEDAEGLTVVQSVGSAALVDAVREARSAVGPVTIDVQHRDHDLRAVVSPVGDQTLVILADRTRELQVEEIRRNFVVNASHELKTPVTSIQTLAEALQVTLHSDPPRAAALAGRLGDEAERLARLVRDLLDLRRLEERGPLERAPVDLAAVARRIVVDQGVRAEARDVLLTADVPEKAVVVGVPGDLDVIVKNLVGNAVQYNRPGGTVVVAIEPQEGRQVLTVRDTGIGIPQQDLARIFERFYRVDTARSRETGGTGLGLSIVRHAVERHGGSIRVDSLLGEGTTFTVSLPVEPPS